MNFLENVFVGQNKEAKQNKETINQTQYAVQSENWQRNWNEFGTSLERVFAVPNSVDDIPQSCRQSRDSRGFIKVKT